MVQIFLHTSQGKTGGYTAYCKHAGKTAAKLHSRPCKQGVWILQWPNKPITMQRLGASWWQFLRNSLKSLRVIHSKHFRLREGCVQPLSSAAAAAAVAAGAAGAVITPQNLLFNSTGALTVPKHPNVSLAKIGGKFAWNGAHLEFSNKMFWWVQQSQKAWTFHSSDSLSENLEFYHAVWNEIISGTIKWNAIKSK